ncbi:MAG: flagellar hook-basal body complex protein [Proteobacteria bacterium]|nr:flagellar hook-basal body complex protein [Pseudomonadota bacterium]
MTDSLGIAKQGIKQGNLVMQSLAANMSNSRAVAGKGSQYFMHSVSDGAGTANGVSGYLVNNISAQGATVSVDNQMYCAAGSNGFFVCDKGVTRVGTWAFDKDGDCANHLGNKLLVYQLDANGNRVNPNNTTEIIADNTTTNFMTHINQNNIQMEPTATSKLTYAYQLPVEATTTGSEITTDATVYDSLGVAHNLKLTFTRAQIGANTGGQTVIVTPTGQQAADPLNDGNNIITTTGVSSAWFLKVAPSNVSADDTITGTYGSTDGMLIEFDASGRPLAYNNSQLASSGNSANGVTTAPNLTTTYGNLSAAGDIEIDFGAVGSNEGLVASGNKQRVINIEANGNSAGDFVSFEWSKDGYGIVKYDNGMQQKKFLMPLAYFPNADGLDFDSNGLYQASVASGSVLYDIPGGNKVGYITPSSYEDSTISAIDTQIDIVENQQYFMGQTTAFKIAKELLEAFNRVTG